MESKQEFKHVHRFMDQYGDVVESNRAFVGVAYGVSKETGDLGIMVMVDEDKSAALAQLRRDLPSSINEVPIFFEHTGPFSLD